MAFRIDCDMMGHAYVQQLELLWMQCNLVTYFRGASVLYFS